MTGRHFETNAVHGGERGPAPRGTPTATPIYSTSSFSYQSAEELIAIFEGRDEGFVYGRYGTPTGDALQRAVALLEGGEAAVAFASGMAAVHAALLATGAQSGDTVLAAQDLYGASTALFNTVLAPLGLRFRYVDVTDQAAVAGALAEAQPKALYLETMSNPLLKVADIPTLATLGRRYGALVLVDNTFASPYLVQPLQYGADMVIHSATKYLGGHGDVTGGVVVTSAERAKTLASLMRLVGGVLGPQEAWLILRGIKTLALRQRRQCENAGRVASFLAGERRVSRVIYPGLPGHPQHELAQRLFRDGLGGAMVAFELAAGRAGAVRFLDALRLCIPATTLGDVYTLCLHPATSSHSYLSPQERQAVGIGEGLLRLSVGIENAEDIVADLDQALGKAN